MKSSARYISTALASAALLCAALVLTSARSSRPQRQGTITTSTFTYVGGITNGKHDGFGICSYNNGNVYTGFWNMNYKEGLGRMEYADGTMEFGRWQRGLIQIPPGRRFRPGNRVLGIDVSKFQKNIDWSQLAIRANADGRPNASGRYLQPVLFIIVKSTQGRTVRNPYFRSQFDGAKEHGIIRGAYHFMSHMSSGSDQARYFINNTPLVSGDLPPILDLEIEERLMRRQHREIIAAAREWLRIVEAHYGVKPIIYTNENYYYNYLHGHGFDGYDFWIACYRSSVRHRDCVIWQFTERGKVQGINHNTDLNEFRRGNYAAFKQYVATKGIR